MPSLDETYNSRTDAQTSWWDKRGKIVFYVVVVLLLVSWGVFVGMASQGQFAEDTGNLEIDNKQVYNDVRPSVVSVYVNASGGDVQGTGFVYEKGSIITNYHVISGASDIYVQYSNGEWSRASVVGADFYTDIAVLAPKTKPAYADALKLSTKLPSHGQEVAVIGTPNGLRGTITTGVVSGTGRTVQTGTGFRIPDVVQTDSALNNGNSGGPLVTADGTVVGVVNSRQGENLGFAISSRVVKTVADSLIRDGQHKHSFMGVSSTEITPYIADANGYDTTKGVIVVNTFNKTDANGKFQAAEYKKANGTLIPIGGDIITSIDGNEVRDSEDISSYLLRKTSPGDVVTVTIQRDGKTLKKEIKLSSRPSFTTGLDQSED